MGWLGRGLGTNGLWGRGRTDRRRGAVLEVQDCLKFMSNHLIQLPSTHAERKQQQQTNMKRNIIHHALSLLIATAALFAAVAPAQAQDKKPNILFIMGDDIGWMQPSC